MANRYQYQFNGSLKPRMSQMEGFVSIGTGGLLNTQVAIASGGVIGGSGTYYAAIPGQDATAGAPTGWVGGFSGCVGLLGAGVQSVSRIATGLYAVQLQDDWVRLDSCQIQPVSGSTGLATALSVEILTHTVGLGNTVSTGAIGSLSQKNQILIQFHDSTSALAQDPALGSGFFLDIRVRDSLAGPQ